MAPAPPTVRAPDRPRPDWYRRAVVKNFGAALATVLVLALVLVQPFVGRHRYQRLSATEGADTGARQRHYLRGIVGEWLAVAVIVLVGGLTDRGPASIGLAGGPHRLRAAVCVAVVAVALGVSAVAFRTGGESMRDRLRGQARGFRALLPRTGMEKLYFTGYAVTAGVCEELMFRGFGFAYLRWLWPSASAAAVVIVTAAAFGLVHWYQGRRGVVVTGALGVAFGWVTIFTGTLLPAMVLHALMDLRILALPDLEPTPAPTP
jgi:membrane protease YdiL (CAAX protease family)